MSAQAWALIAAGVIGALVAVVHGVLLQRLAVKPVLSKIELSSNMQRLFPLLMHFSTICWFFGGLVLIVASFYFDESATLTSAAFVGVFYLIGALGNLWGTRGRHPGWILLAIAVGLIVFAVTR